VLVLRDDFLVGSLMVARGDCLLVLLKFKCKIGLEHLHFEWLLWVRNVDWLVYQFRWDGV
jgi:hypothetical protein